MLITTMMLGVLVFQVWKWNRCWQRATIGAVPHRRRHLLRLEHHQDPRRRLVPVAGRGGQLHRADDLGQGPRADARAAAGIGAAAARCSSSRRRFGPPGARHLGVPVDLGRQRARGAAPQSEAQPGASRARADPEREGRGRAARPRRRSGSRCTTPAHGFYRVVLHYGFMEEVDIPARPRRRSGPAASRST